MCSTSCLRYDERDTSPMPTRWPRNNERIWSAVVATGSSPSNRPRLSSLLRGLPTRCSGEFVHRLVTRSCGAYELFLTFTCHKCVKIRLRIGIH